MPSATMRTKKLPMQIATYDQRTPVQKTPRHATRGPSGAEAVVRGLLASADVAIGGARPWDVEVHDRRFYETVLAQGSLGAGESYMAGQWDSRDLDGTLYRVMKADLDLEVRQ